jgi:DNA-directed RNA polymerase subunit RPC12/RpoP
MRGQYTGKRAARRHLNAALSFVRMLARAYRRLTATHCEEIYHNGMKSFVCSACGSVFAKRLKFKRHALRIHDEVRTYICSFCSSSFLSKYSLDDHLKLHHDTTYKHIQQIRTLKCSFRGCSAYFISQDRLDVHEKSHES